MCGIAEENIQQRGLFGGMFEFENVLGNNSPVMILFHHFSDVLFGQPFALFPLYSHGPMSSLMCEIHPNPAWWWSRIDGGGKSFLFSNTVVLDFSLSYDLFTQKAC